MLRSSHDACGCSIQTTSTINLKRSTLHPHEGQADRPNTPSDSVNLGSNPGPSATNPSDIARFRVHVEVTCDKQLYTPPRDAWFSYVGRKNFLSLT
jgi:hypothetical protein